MILSALGIVDVFLDYKQRFEFETFLFKSIWWKEIL